ncbi:ATP synthase protein I-related protein [Cinnamomum micranthum f. kanehirae]|uniref:ATP synthase protein I-related protein n=1 Tax=Cinnamomum micranthum f. kanehirae TaxID=337451 RepID=A0A443Q377_9MAGN|nr:ATP synthase protein I-related protein [Cinnamomum micranthum f. kanehirae]
MAVLNSISTRCFSFSSRSSSGSSYISPSSAATPISEESQELDPSRRQGRVILPKKKPLKWSTGVAPGDYGGPPTTTKLRKYWGGDDDDPLTSDDFIWNKDFMSRMKRTLFQPSPSSSSSIQSPPSNAKEESGFLSLNRAMSLDSVEIDLSKELVAPPKPVLELQVEAARSGQLATDSSGGEAPKWRFVPTRREQKKWDRANKAATGGSDVLLRDSKKVRGDPKVLAAQAREQYFKLKRKLQTLTLGIGSIGVFSAYVSYSPEIAASFGAGFLGSLVYIRMLGNTVDSMADGARGLMKGAVGQPRLLVPVVLVMIYNRWNGILVPDYGFMQLDLIPMLVGFFTYKIATFVQAIEEALTIVERKQEV